jgi:hypothetical protein
MTANQAFLEAAVRWIRAALEAGTASAPAARQARTALDDAIASQRVPFATLAERLELSPFERDLLLLTAAVEIDTAIPSLMAVAQGDPSRRYPSFALAMSIFDGPSWDAMSPSRPLRAHQLVELHQSGATSLLAAPLRIDERIAAHIKGVTYLDERLAAMVTRLPERGPLPPSQEAIAGDLAGWLANADCRGLVQLAGIHRSAKRDVVSRAATVGGRDAFEIPVDALPAAADDLSAFTRLWSREAMLRPILLLVCDIDGIEPFAGEDTKAPRRHRWPDALAEIAGPCLLDVRGALPHLESTPLVTVLPPTDNERRRHWCDALASHGCAPDDTAIQRLASEFALSTSQVDHIATQAFAAADGHLSHQSLVTARAWHGCVQRAGAALATLTRWIDPRVALVDVKLPASEKAHLARLVLHTRQRSTVTGDFGFSGRGERGLGLAVLFHGESGTGKTFAAEAVARELGLGLAVTELARIQSKYLGETEKNLARIFDAAEEGGAVLFFDEADALFGKRSEVKDSHDRYANIEINYLLSRMERFRGVTILATNQKHALDRAFLRRLRFVVAFPFPGLAERAAIWQEVFPPQTPLGELDVTRLARFSLSGGNIFNAAVTAAHEAAAEGSSVEMRHVLDAIRWELRKIERPVAEAEFRDVLSRERSREVVA